MTGSSSQPPASSLDGARGAHDLLTANGLGSTSDHGAALWDFLRSFVSARRTFLKIYRRYEDRVMGAARRLKVGRDDLVLPPSDLVKLFNLRRMVFLRDVRLKPLRELAEQIFAERGDEELLDVYCSHIYHELSILSEEHRSVGRFLRIQDRRRYRQLFEEVSGYYPKRLRRIRRLFTGGLRRIELMLPTWAQHRVVIRSVYLFGDRLALHAYGQDVGTLYSRMYPEGGEVKGLLEVARSFYESDFVTRSRGAAQRAIDAAARIKARRPLERAEEKALKDAEALRAHLDKEAGVKTTTAAS